MTTFRIGLCDVGDGTASLGLLVLLYGCDVVAGDVGDSAYDAFLRG